MYMTIEQKGNNLQNLSKAENPKPFDPFDPKDQNRIAKLNTRFEPGNQLDRPADSLTVLSSKISSVLDNVIKEGREDRQKTTEHSNYGDYGQHFSKDFTKALSSREGVENILFQAGVDVTDLIIEVSTYKSEQSLGGDEDTEGDPVMDTTVTIKISNKAGQKLFANSCLTAREYL